MSLCGHTVSLHLGKFLGMALLGHRVHVFTALEPTMGRMDSRELAQRSGGAGAVLGAWTRVRVVGAGKVSQDVD